MSAPTVSSLLRVWREYPYIEATPYDLVFHGFCATLSQAEVEHLRGSPDVEAIYEDGYAEIATVEDNAPLSAEEFDALLPSLDADATLGVGQDFNEIYAPISQEELKEFRSFTIEPEAERAGTLATQANAPWGLQRIIQRGRLGNQNDRALNFTYTLNGRAGRGVDAYILDTGIFIRHPQFRGRARWGATFGGHANIDDNGHGSHCAGTVGSNQFGVAKEVSLIAVKVLGRDGKGRWSDIISGMDWVARSAANTRRPSIASMSLGGSAFQPVDQAVANLTSRGIHVVVSAGNNNADARGSSPARAPSAITIGASRISDARAAFSNFGPALDLFAPGEQVISTWNQGQHIQSLSGTSMACPHVSGVLALLISVSGNGTPAAWQNRLRSMAVRNVLTNLPPNTPNLLLQAR